ncbi:MAG: hypothetical protein L0323_07320 [Planctomycetes bacterium]|nr:hypothetical protein [Planctomycetota bacterium]
MRDPRDPRLPSSTPGAPVRRVVALLLATAALGGVAGAQPPNDYCPWAIPITDGYNGLFSNVGASPLNTLPMGCSLSNSAVWFVYQPGSSGTRNFSTCGTGGSLGDTVIQVLNGTALYCAGPIPLACNDDACGTLRSSVTVNVTSLSIYFIRVAGGGFFSQGTFGIMVTGPQPPNNECVGAIEVFGGEIYSNRFATNSGSVAAFCNLSYNSDVWFKWVATCTGYATFSTCQDPPLTVPYDPLPNTVIQVLSGTCGSLVGIGQNCNDDACGSNGLKSRITVPVTAGTTYFIRVAEWGSTPTYGEFTLGIDCCPGSFTSIPTGCGATATLFASGTPCPGGAVSYSYAGTTDPPLIWIGLPTSIPLCPPASCVLGASQLVVLATGGIDAAVPNDPALSGLTLAVQAAEFATSGGCGPPFFGVDFTVSNTIVTTIG